MIAIAASIAQGSQNGNQTQNQVSHSKSGLPWLQSFKIRNTNQTINPIDTNDKPPEL